jgi:hypothetical protein
MFDQPQISKGQFLAMTILLSVFIIAAIVMVFLGDFPIIIPIIIMGGLDLVYIIRIFDYELDKKETRKWIILIILFNVLAVPFFWKKFH